MRILGIETSGSTSSVALVADGMVMSERMFASRQVICQVLAREILNVLGTETVRQANLVGIAVSIGPGSYTGLRVGVTMAKALAHSCHVPVVGISTPEAWAAALGAPRDSMVAVVQPARVSHVYLTTCRARDSSALIEESPPQLLSVEVAGTALSEMSASQPLYLTGDAVGQLHPFCGGGRTLAPKSGEPAAPAAETAEDDQPGRCPRASIIAQLGTERLGEADGQSHFTLRPRYVGLSQAERTRGINLGL